MDRHTDAFVEPTRIALARTIRGFSRASAARALGISAPHYANLELGHRDASDHLEHIASTFRYPAAFFSKCRLDIPKSATLSYRRKSSMAVADQLRTQASAAIAGSDLRELLGRYVSSPGPSVPDMSSFATLPAVKCGEAAASALRASFQMGNAPLRHVIDLLEALGVAVFWLDGPDEFDAVSLWLDGVPVVLLNRNRADGYRMRHSALHELGHLLLHRHVELCGKAEDQQANAFASAILMPAGTFARAIPRHFNPDVLLEDRAIWGASVAAMARRAFDLGIYSEWSYRDAFIRLSALGWRTAEPKPTPPEESTVHKFFFDEAGDRGLTSFHLADECGQPYDDFAAAFPLARLYESKGPSLGSIFG